MKTYVNRKRLNRDLKKRLINAISNNNLEHVKALLASGVKREICQFTLADAIANGQYEIVQRLIR